MIGSRFVVDEERLTCGLLLLHDGCDILTVGGLLGASHGVLVFLSDMSVKRVPFANESALSTYHASSLLLGRLAGLVTLVATSHLGLLKGPWWVVF